MKLFFWSVILTMATVVGKAQDHYLCKKLYTEIFENEFFPAGENNLVILHIGSFENLQSTENIITLNKLQIEFPEIKVVAALSSNSENELPYQQLKKLYNLAIPIIAIKKENVLNCFENAQPVTLILGPEQKIIKTYRKLPSYNDVRNQLQEITKTYPVNSSPFFGVAPHDFQKSFLMECLDGITIDTENERIFVSDYCQNIIIAISPYGEILEVIGNITPGDEVGEIFETVFNGPRGIAFDVENQRLFVADSRNNAIKVIDYREQNVKRITIDSLQYPTRLFISGVELYITSPQSIWRYNLLNEIAEKVIPDSLFQPLGIAISRKGTITFAESGNTSISSIYNDRLKRLKNQSKNEMIFPAGLAFYGNKIITTDIYRHAVFSVRPSRLNSKPIAGNFKSGYKNGNGKNAIFNLPTDIAIWGNTAYVTDMGNGLIRKIDLITNHVSVLNLTEYLKLSYRYSPQTFNLLEADTLFLPYGKNVVDIKFSFSGTYELDQKGFSYVTIVSRNRSLNTLESILTNRIPRFELEVGEKNTDVLIDFHLFFKDAKFPEMIYKQSFSLQVPVEFSPKTKDNQHVLNVVFDPDQFQN